MIHLNLGKPKPAYKTIQGRDIKKIDVNEMEQSIVKSNIEERIDNVSTVENKLNELNRSMKVSSVQKFI